MRVGPDTVFQLSPLPPEVGGPAEEESRGKGVFKPRSLHRVNAGHKAVGWAGPVSSGSYLESGKLAGGAPQDF